MAIQLSETVRNARLDAVETATGATAKLEIRTGGVPANCAAASTGTVLATLTLPADWMAAAASGSKAKAGTWEDLSADATGTAAHFRIFDNAGTTCHLQGTFGTGSEDMVGNTTSFTAGQSVTINTFTLTDANS